MKIRMIQDYNSVVNNKKYTKGEVCEVVELEHFPNIYARYYKGTLSVNPKIEGSILDWISKKNIVK